MTNREFKTYGNGSLKKYVQPKYDKTVLDLFEKEGDKQVLYKVVDPDTLCGFHKGGIAYKLGENIIAYDFDPNPNRECGGGLHLCFKPLHTRAFGKGKILKCLADPADIVIYPDNIEKVRCRMVTPVSVVDIRGKEIIDTNKGDS